MELDNSEQIRDREEILRIMAVLCRSPEVRLQLESRDHSYAVSLAEAANDRLRLDLGSTPDIAAHIEKGERFLLTGQAQGALITTPLLQAQSLGEELFQLDLPQTLSSVRRRETFRATLYHDMATHVALTTSDGERVSGTLGNLSVSGCQVKLPLIAAATLADVHDAVNLTITFPNGQQLEAAAEIRHLRKDGTWQNTNAGCRFVEHRPGFERSVSDLVREIERHAARRADRYDRWLEPSQLFTEDAVLSRSRHEPPEETVAAIAAFLSKQVAQMQAGRAIDVDKLLICSHALRNQLRSDREALLFAASRLGHQSAIICHGIAVAARLADMVHSKFSKEELRTIVACALVHDLGKALLPAAVVNKKTALNADERTIMHTHVARLVDLLPRTNALPAVIIDHIITSANERLDGSGYPNQRQGDDLSKLARTMTVIDVADAMSRPRADRPPLAQSRIHQHLLSSNTLFDSKCVQRHIRRFGKTPIGALAQYSSGVLGWIQRLDKLGEPIQVQLALQLGSKNRPLDKVVSGNDMNKLGRIEALVEASEFEL